jgi:hypothetical protein
MAKLPSNVLQFAAGDNDLKNLFVEMQDYWNHYRTENMGKKLTFDSSVSLAEKERLLNDHLIREVAKMAGVDFTVAAPEQFMSHPMVAWAANLIVSQLIDAVLPDTIIDSTALFADVRVAGYAESMVFDINSRDLFPVSRAGHMGMREAEVHKGFQGQVVLNPEQRQITTEISLYRVLAGQESLAVFVNKLVRSIETEMASDIYTTLSTAMDLLSTTAETGLRVTGFTQADMVKLAQKVSAYNGGSQAVMVGTKAALQQVLPDDANYRMALTDDYVKVGYIRELSGVKLFELPQVANWKNPFATLLNNDRLWLIAPATDKLVKVVLGGPTISNTTGTFDSATLTQRSTFYKAWKTGVVTSSVGGVITL